MDGGVYFSKAAATNLVQDVVVFHCQREESRLLELSNAPTAATRAVFIDARLVNIIKKR